MRQARPDVLLLGGPRPEVRAASGSSGPLPVAVVARPAGRAIAWSVQPGAASSDPTADSLAFDLGRDLPELASFPSFPSAMDAWWQEVGPLLSPGGPLVFLLPFPCFPLVARAVRRWARRLRRPLVLACDVLLPVAAGVADLVTRLEALPTGSAEEVCLHSPGMPRVRLQLVRSAAWGRVEVREGEGAAGAPALEVSDPLAGVGALAGWLTGAAWTGFPLRFCLRPSWGLREPGATVALWGVDPDSWPGPWMGSLGLEPASEGALPSSLEIWSSLGERPSRSARVGLLPLPAEGRPVRVQLEIGRRRIRARALTDGATRAGDFLEFLAPTLVA